MTPIPRRWQVGRTSYSIAPGQNGVGGPLRLLEARQLDEASLVLHRQDAQTNRSTAPQ